MSNETTKNDQKQRFKKYAVFTAMAFVFAISMWLIFAPSGADKAKKEMEAGFNSDIPDPHGAGIVGDKKTAYEQELARQKQADKMQTLQEYDLMFGQQKDEQEIYERQLRMAPVPIDYQEQLSKRSSSGRAGSSLQSSTVAYHEINRTLGNFYEIPKEDKEEKELKQKLEEMQIIVDAKSSDKSSAFDEQVALMEKSYELAAKYMPQGQGQNQASVGVVRNSPISSNSKTRVSSIEQVREQTVSALSQQIDDIEFVRQMSRPRNFDFLTVGDDQKKSDRNTISATVHNDQTLIDGQSVRLRLSESILIDNILIPPNTIVTGQAKIEGERLNISVYSIEYGGKITTVDLTVYDTDGQQGVHIPGSMEINSAKEILANMGSGMGSSINISRQGAAEQLVTDAGRGLIQGTSQYVSKKIQQVKVTLKAGHKLLLLSKDNL